MADKKYTKISIDDLGKLKKALEESKSEIESLKEHVNVCLDVEKHLRNRISELEETCLTYADNYNSLKKRSDIELDNINKYENKFIELNAKLSNLDCFEAINIYPNYFESNFQKLLNSFDEKLTIIQNLEYDKQHLNSEINDLKERLKYKQALLNRILED